jgi:peptide chain release factor 3
MQMLPHHYARWIVSSPDEPAKLNLTSSTRIIRDSRENYVLLFENEWSIQWAKDKNKGLELSDISP